MNIIDTGILNALSDGKWHSATEIINAVCTATNSNRVQVNSALHAMSGRKAIMKEREDIGHRRCRFRIGAEQNRFGASASILMFDNLLKSVRAS